MQIIRQIGCWVAVALCFFLPSDADAYILPSRYYLKKFAESRRHIRTLQATLKTTLVSSGVNKGLVYEERLFISLPGKIRLERWQESEFVQVAIYRQKDALVWQKKREVAGTSSQANRLQQRASGSRSLRLRPITRSQQPRFDFFSFGRNGIGYGRLQNLLKRYGVNYRGMGTWQGKGSGYREQKYVSLAWWKRHPVIVLGASFGDRQRNQIWIDKARFIPIRFIGKLAPNGPLFDVRFLDYISSSYGLLFPGRIEVYRDSKLYLRSLIYNLKINQFLPSERYKKVR